VFSVFEYELLSTLKTLNSSRAYHGLLSSRNISDGLSELAVDQRTLDAAVRGVHYVHESADDVNYDYSHSTFSDDSYGKELDRAGTLVFEIGKTDHIWNNFLRINLRTPFDVSVGANPACFQAVQKLLKDRLNALPEALVSDGLRNGVYTLNPLNFSQFNMQWQRRVRVHDRSRLTCRLCD